MSAFLVIFGGVGLYLMLLGYAVAFWSGRWR
jgi:hypothetical protein